MLAHIPRAYVAITADELAAILRVQAAPMPDAVQRIPLREPRYHGRLSPLAYRREPMALDDPATFVTDEDVTGWIERDPFVRDLTRPKIARCLAWLWLTFGRGV